MFDLKRSISIEKELHLATESESFRDGLGETQVARQTKVSPKYRPTAPANREMSYISAITAIVAFFNFQSN